MAQRRQKHKDAPAAAAADPPTAPRSEIAGSASAGVGKKRKRAADLPAEAGSGAGSSSSRLVAEHDLAGAAVVTVKLASGSGSGWADLMLKPDADNERRVLVYSFGRALSADDLAAAFGRAGPAALLGRETLDADPASGVALHCAALEFRDAAAAARAVDTPSSFPPADGDGHALGLKGLLGALGTHRQDPRELQLAADIFMGAFEAAEETAAAAKAAVAKAMDADGFTVVKYGRGRGGDDAAAGAGAALGTGGGGFAAAASATLTYAGGALSAAVSGPIESDNIKRKRKRGSLVVADFYRFQRKDAKRDRVAELRARFEEDKARLKALAEKKAFKPI